MKITAKLYLVLLLPLSLLVIVGTVLSRSNRIIKLEAQRESIVDEVTRGTFELNLLTYEYLQHHLPRAKQQWQQKHASLTEKLASVDFPMPRDYVTLAEARWTLAQLGDLFTDLVSTEDAASTAGSLVQRELQERLVGQLIAESQSLISLTATLSRTCDEMRVRTRRFSYLLTIVFIGVTAIGIGVSMILVSSGITRPIRQLRRGAEELASGRLDQKIGNAANDEVGELARTFDHMAESLQRRAEERDHALKALQLDEERLEALLKLNQMTGVPLKELTDFALETAVTLTESKIGYLAFLNEDETVLTMHSWSREAMKECAIIEKPIVYNVVETGLWGEAVRQRKPVITNDYLAPNPLKKGHPEGHVPVLRHMNVPIFEGDHIVAVAGVGNKEAPYDDTDVRQLTLLMQGMWRLIQQRRAEEELRRHRDHLEELVAERTAELRQTTTELARSNKELEMFAYVASHDLQEPLRAVAGFVELLRQRYAGKLDDKADQYITFAVDGVKRMQLLISGLLEYSRVSTRGDAFQVVDCEVALTGALENLHVAIQESQAVVTHDPLPQVQGDPSQLLRLLQNLLGNAIKFRSQQPPRIHVGAEKLGTEWQFSVRDNGIGIDSQFFDRVFIIFQRLHTQKQYTGTGLGLAICKRIVERHGGRIWVESVPAHGSTFFFTLPVLTRGGHTP